MQAKRSLSFPLRLCPSVRQQATELAHQEHISLNHFISLAVAEKITRMEHEAWLRQQRAAPGLQGSLGQGPRLLRRTAGQ